MRISDWSSDVCSSDLQSLPPGLCPLITVARCEGLLLPKVRRQFAEFLQHPSLKRLGILYQPTCVGFGYGLYGEAISWNHFEAGSIQLDPPTHVKIGRASCRD